MIELYKAARTAAVPFLAIRTPDQIACERQLVDATGPDYAMVRWDAARGMTSINDRGKTAMASAGITGADTIGFGEAMLAAWKLPPSSVLVAHNVHRQLQAQEPLAVAGNVQAMANLRSHFSSKFRMLVCLAPDITFPAELQHDVVWVDDPLPGSDILKPIIAKLYDKAKALSPKTVPVLTPDLLEKADDAVAGLAQFETEQVTSMSLSETGLDVSALWERKRVAIEQTPGLSVYRGKETLDDIRGCDAVKARLRMHLKARTKLGVIVWIDEGADVFQNVESDTSGNKTDQQRMLLMKMEQHGWRGVILVGPPGTGKSALARGFGGDAGVPTIELDLAGMESKWQGESEQNLRQGINVIERVGRGNAFFMLTCNNLQGIRPQFMARFRRGTFFVDMPSPEERAAIWQLYLSKYKLLEQVPDQRTAKRIDQEGWRYVGPRPNDHGWVGREIRECCESAWDCSLTLKDAARYIIPVSQSRRSDIVSLRQQAHDRFIDASLGEAYQYKADLMDEGGERGMAMAGSGVPQ